MAKKGYWIAQFEVSDPEAYKTYQAEVSAMFREHGATYIVRGGRSHIEDGHGAIRTVVIEFSDYKSALQCYLSPRYEAVKKLREGHATGHIVVVEGHDAEGS